MYVDDRECIEQFKIPDRIPHLAQLYAMSHLGPFEEHLVSIVEGVITVDEYVLFKSLVLQGLVYFV
jgi:hypothetical protein